MDADATHRPRCTLNGRDRVQAAFVSSAAMRSAALRPSRRPPRRVIRRARRPSASPLPRRSSQPRQRRHQEQRRWRPRRISADRQTRPSIRPTASALAGDQRAPQVHQQHGLPVAVPDVHQPVVDVLLVGVPMPWPRHVRRTIASTTSRNGIEQHEQRHDDRARDGGEVARRSAGTGCAPTPEIVAIARSMPEQHRPRVAHEDLRRDGSSTGRNPMQMPAVIAERSAAADASPNRLSGCGPCRRRTRAAAIATMPAASPSSPSTRFTAFAMSDDPQDRERHGEVGGDATGSAPADPARTRSTATCTPSSDEHAADEDLGRQLGERADTPRVSSIDAEPDHHRAGHEGGERLGARRGAASAKNGRTSDEAPTPTRNPTYIASPPIVGVGFGCTLRSDGWSIAPMRSDSRRTSGVAANVVRAARRRRRGRRPRSAQCASPPARGNGDLASERGQG